MAGSDPPRPLGEALPGAASAAVSTPAAEVAMLEKDALPHPPMSQTAPYTATPSPHSGGTPAMTTLAPAQRGCGSGPVSHPGALDWESSLHLSSTFAAAAGPPQVPDPEARTYEGTPPNMQASA